MPVEALLFSTWGTTPGKWLLCSELRQVGGARLSQHDAWRRSLEVYLRGQALGIALLQLVAQLVAWWQLRSRGATVWDTRGGFAVTHYRIGVARFLVSLLLLVGPHVARAILSLV